MSNRSPSQENVERNENKDIEKQCPSKVVEFVSKRKFEPLVRLFLRWYDEILVLFRAIAVSLDLLFLYVPVIKEDKKCIGLNKVLFIIAIVLRSVIDIIYIVHFVVKSKIRRDERNNESNTTCWAKVRRHLWFIMFNVLFILPIPQVVMPSVFSEMRRTKSSNITILNSVILLHYGARVSQIYRYILADHASAEKCDKASVWIKASFYLFLYILAGHVMGAFWYFFSTQRLMACWHKACEIHGDGVEISFNCDHSFRKLSFLDDFCRIDDTPNPSSFDFGIFLEARRSKILESTGFLQKVLYCCWWGLRNLSSFGSNLQISSYIWENIFALGISILGLLLFLYFMGNLQMAPSPQKKKSTAKKADKRLKMDSKLFRSVHHFERYKDNFLNAGIIQERFVDLEDLRQTFIPSCFEGKGWEKLLSGFPVVCEPLIREFYSNAVIKDNELSCWVRGKEFVLDAHVIDDALGLEGLDDEEFINYKDRSVSIETVQQRIGGQREGKCLNTTAFPVDMRCLTIIMMFNLYPIKKLTTINCARAVFLMDLKEKNFIDISSHIYDTIVDETRTTSRPKLIFPSLLMRIFRSKGVPIPQDISLMSTPSAINKLTCKRISVRLPGEEDEGDEGEAVPMETEAEAAGLASTSTPRRSGKRHRASTSADTPPDAFQIILERLDGIRAVQTEHSDRMRAMQDQIDVLAAKLDSFTTQHDQ